MKTKNTFLLAACLALLAAAASAQTNRYLLPQQDGEALYKGICQDCHMPDGKGGEGAGHYPALARNPKLAEAGYPLSVVSMASNPCRPLATRSATSRSPMS